jgi:hypothetical protein
MAMSEGWLDRKQGLVLWFVAFMLALVMTGSGMSARGTGQGGVYRQLPGILVGARVGLGSEILTTLVTIVVNMCAYYVLIRILAWLGSQLSSS